jgi:asparagine synthase (glutamine-hydrolysing)
MSGFVGLHSLDGSPVDRSLLERLTTSLAFRGPDGQEVWGDGPAGFGHAMLSTGAEPARERRACAVDGAWIAGDVRIDARGELIVALEAAGRRGVRQATDAELILHAWHAWGEGCAARLLGDFAFAIWDGKRRVLLCARDQFGIRPFYYARLRRSAASAREALVFSNTLEAILQHPGVSDQLNDSAIADFLLFGYSRNPSETTFAGVHSLPPGHCLVCTGGEVRVERYWSLDVESVRFRRPADYVERFNELLDEAVADRLRDAPRAAILMSGGLDSPSIAASAMAGPGAAGTALQAFTYVYDGLIPHDERQWAGMVGKHLGIPIEYIGMDGYRLYREGPLSRSPKGLRYASHDDRHGASHDDRHGASHDDRHGASHGDSHDDRHGASHDDSHGDSHDDRRDDPTPRTPEPIDNPLWAVPVDVFRRVADAGYRVLLCGEGGDASCAPGRMLPALLRTGRLWPIARDIVSYWQEHGRRPPLGMGRWIRNRDSGFRIRKSEVDSQRADSGFPDWLNGDLVRRLNLRERWADAQAEDARYEPAGEAYRELRSSFWPWCLLLMDAGWARSPVEVRYPFFDLRLVRFLLGVPGVPWSHDKQLLRAAARSRLPREVCVRPKTPLSDDPVAVLFRRDGPPPIVDAGGALWEFVDRDAFTRAWQADPAAPGWRRDPVTRPLSLGRWLAG